MTPIQFINNVNNIEIKSDDKKNILLFLIDLNCPNQTDYLSMVNDELFAHPYRWIIINNLTQIDNETNYDLMENINPLTDSNIILVSHLTEISYKLEQFYRTEKYSEIIYEEFGLWNEINGLNDLRGTRILSRRRKNLHKKKLSASLVIIVNDTLNHLTDYKDRHVDAITKINYVFVNHLMDILNASKKFTYVPSWGYKNTTTNQWSGMIGEITRMEADIGGTPLFVTPDRVPIIEYISMTTPTGALFVFRAPPLSYVANIYFLPFDGLVWVCSGALILLCIFIIYLTLKLQSSNDKKTNYKPEENVRSSDVIFLAVGAICQMGPQNEPRTNSSRLSTLFLFIAALFFYTSYSANIVALLQSTTTSINTLKDLLESQLEFGVEDTVYNRYYFSTETEPIRKALYQTKIIPPKKPNRYMNLTSGVKRLQQGLFAFHMEPGSGYKLVEETFYEHEKCGLIEIPFIQVISPWFAIQKYSPYKEMLKVNLFKIREHGLQSRELSRIYTKRPVCSSQGQNFGSVGLTDCFVAIIILAYGFLLAFLLFIFEKLLFIKKSKICLY